MTKKIGAAYFEDLFFTDHKYKLTSEDLENAEYSVSFLNVDDIAFNDQISYKIRACLPNATK